jgi:RNA polymerase sigma factor (sigma-70 family)
MDPERAILDAIRQGDQRRAASLIVRHLGGLLLGLAQVLVGRADAEDLVQETVMALLEALQKGRFLGRSTLRVYAVKTLRRQASHVRGSFWRRLKRSATAPDDEEELPAPAPDSEPRWASHDTPDLIRKLIGLLDARSRLVLSMELEGMPTAGIGKVLGISEAAVRQIRCRALHRLHGMIDDDPRAAAIVRGEGPQKLRRG